MTTRQKWIGVNFNPCVLNCTLPLVTYISGGLFFMPGPKKTHIIHKRVRANGVEKFVIFDNEIYPSSTSTTFSPALMPYDSFHRHFPSNHRDLFYGQRLGKPRLKVKNMDIRITNEMQLYFPFMSLIKMPLH